MAVIGRVKFTDFIFAILMTVRTDTASKLIHASASVLYRAFASAEAMQAWLPPAGMRGKILAFSFREGGSYRMRLDYIDSEHAPGKTSTDADEVEVQFIKLVPDECIEETVVFKSEDPAFSGEMLIVWTFEPAEQGTLVTVRCENVPSGIRQNDHLAGLRSTLDNLAKYASLCAASAK